MWNILSLFKSRKHFNNSEKEFRSAVEKLCHYPIGDLRIFEEAFTLRGGSAAKAHFNFERLEFLGDAVIGSIVSGFLFVHYPNANEGFLTKMKSKLVNRSSLNAVGEKLKLTSLLVNKENGLSLSTHIHGDLFEALVGAVYEDMGYQTCYQLILDLLLNKNNLQQHENRVISYKSLLLERAQKNKIEIHFETTEAEEARPNLQFIGSVWIGESKIAEGFGRSKKKALEYASEQAFQLLQNHEILDFERKVAES